MAIKPADSDTFMREVDEELRKERFNRLFARYGWAIIAGVILILAAIGGWIWWQNKQQAERAEQGAALLSALESIDAGNRNAAAPKIAMLAESDAEGYRAAALFARAGMEAEAGNAAGAAATLGEIAGDADFAEPYRHAALIRQTALQFDRLQPQAVIQRLAPLARPGSPWFGSAGEMVGIAHMKMNRPDLAGPIFAGIARDESVPPSIRTRAIQMAGSLGINAMPESEAPAGAQEAAAPAAEQVQGAAVPAAAREKAE